MSPAAQARVRQGEVMEIGATAATAGEVASLAQIQQLQHELAQAKAELQDFTYTVSHDLRAPLRHIQAYVAVIEEDFTGLPAELTQHLNTIATSAQLLARQLEALTQLARVGQQQLHLQALAWAPLVSDVLADLKADAVLGRRVLDVHWQVAPDLPTVWGDANLLRQVLRQVLHNAVKATLHTPAPQVHITSPAGGQLCVQDNGLGFAPSQADALFKVFGKAHPAKLFDGLGVGLVLCRKQLARLQGQIILGPQPGAGCTVTLTLPSA